MNDPVFSQREEDIIKILGRRKMSLQLIAEELFHESSDKPFDAEISVGNSVRRIRAKCYHHKLSWVLAKKRVGGRLLIYKEAI